MATASERSDIDRGRQFGGVPLRSLPVRVRGREVNAVDVVFWVAVPLTVVVLLVLNRHQWFRGDEFDFIVFRRRLWGSGAYADMLFLPHNEHWSTGELVPYLVLFRLFRFSTYLPHLVLLYAFNVTFALALRAVLVRAGYERWLVNAATVLFLLLGSGMENLSWAFQIGFIGGPALGLVALVLSDDDGRLNRRDVVGAAVLLASLTFSGTALTTFAVVIINIVWNRRWRALPVYGALPAAVYGLWYLLWGRTAPRLPVELLAVQPYTERGLQAAIDGLTQLSGAASVIGVAALLSLVWRGRAGRLNSLVVSCALGSVVFFVVGGLSRASLGIDQAASSRYVTIAAGLLMPAIIGLLDDLLRVNPIWGRWATAALLAWALAGNLSDGGAMIKTFERHGGGLRERLAATAALPSFEVIEAGVLPDPELNPNIDIAALRDMIEHDGLTLPPPDPAAMVTAASIVEVRPGSGDIGDPADVAATPIDDTTATADGPCLRLASPSGRVSVVVRTTEDAEITFTAAGPLSVRVVGEGGQAAEPPGTAGGTSLALDHPDYPIEMRAPALTAELCGAHLAPDEPGRDEPAR